MATGNPKYPGLDQKYVLEIEQRTANVPAGQKELLQQRMYSDFYAQQQKEKEQADRLAAKNEIAQKEIAAKGDEKTRLGLQLKKGNLADVVRKYYNLSLSDGNDDEIVDKFTNGIQNGTQMYVDYLNGDNNDIMVKTGLFGDKWKQLNEQNEVKMGGGVSTAATQAQQKQAPTNLTSTSHFDDLEYAADYIKKAPAEYKEFIDKSREQGLDDTWIASVIDAYQLYVDKMQKYEDFENRDFGEKSQEVALGIPQGFVNFFANAYNNLLANNPSIGLTHGHNIDMDKIQFTDELLGVGNNYGDLRAESGWSKTGEFGGELAGNLLLFHYLPLPGEGVQMESLTESALKQGTKGVVKNVLKRGVYGGLEGAEFGAIGSVGQENVTGKDIVRNMEAGGTLGSAFGLLGAGGNAYKYRNTLRTLIKEGDKEGTVRGLLEMYDKGIKPTSRGMKSNTQLQQYNDDTLGAVETIIKNKEGLKYIDAAGEETFGHLPRNVDEFSQAIKQTKKTIYDKYTAIAKEAGKSTDVDTIDIVKTLKNQLKNQEWRAGQSEATISRIEKWIKDLEGLNNKMSVEGAQGKIQELNQKLQAFIKNQNPNDVGTNAVDGWVLNGLKGGVDDAIENAGLDSADYFELRNMYKQLRTIESDVNHRAVVYGRQNPESLVDSLANLSSIDAIAKFLKNPKEGVLKFAGSQLEKISAKNRNNPDKMVNSMFKKADSTISKSETLKSQSQIAGERTQDQLYNIKKSRQQRMDERRSLFERREQARQELLNKQAEQEAAYQEYLKSKWVGSETRALPEGENAGNYNTIIGGDTPITVTPEGVSVRRGQVGEINTASKKTRKYVMDNMNKYNEAKAEYDTFLDGMANDVGGKPIKASLKITNTDGSLREDGISRVLEKAQDKPNGVDDVTDIVRGTLQVSDDEGMQKAKDWIMDWAEKKGLSKSDIAWDDKFTNPTNLGYKDISILYPAENGVRAELQVSNPNLMVAKMGPKLVEDGFMSQAEYNAIVKRAGVEGGKGHDFYQEYRSLEKGIQNGKITGKDADEAVARMAELEKLSKEYYAKFDNLGKGGEVMEGGTGIPTNPTKMSGNPKNVDYNKYQGLSKEIVDNGGITLDVAGNNNLGGKPYVAVSPYPNRSKIIKLDEFNDQQVFDYFKENADKLFEDGYALGGWVNDGNVYLDVSIALPKSMQEEAVNIANKYNQKAIFDLETFEDIPTKGNGEYMDVDEEAVSKYIKSLFTKKK